MSEREQNAERPLLLLVGGNGSRPARFARAWPHLEERFRPMVVEVAGQGGRARAALPATWDGFTDDLAEELARAATEGAAICYGHGIGGLLLADAVRRAPAIAARLVLHAPVGAHLLWRRLPRVMAWRPVAAMARLVLASPFLGARLAHRFLDPEGEARGADCRAFAAGYRQARSFARLFSLTDPLRALEGLEELVCPVTLLWGGRDQMISPHQLPAWAEALPGAAVTARLVPHWYHYPFIDRPREFAAVMAECCVDRLPETPVSLDALVHVAPRTKAGRLAAMRRAGLPVPAGWWVPAAALENGSAAALFSSLPPGKRYAARSSALREDQAHQTAAGVYESELEVAPEALLAACRRVSGSGRPEYFQASSGIPAPSALTCDVLVQEMAPRAAGGVAWVRPLGADLEMASGAFERVVSGATGAVRASLSTLGPPWTEMPPELPAGLTARRLWRLWSHLRQAYHLFDAGTLDMEWCCDHRGQFSLLQARPVGERHPARRLLTAANLREVVPPDPSPFLVGALESLSQILPRYYARFDPQIAAWREPFSVTVAGRPYLNADLYVAMMDRWGLPRALVSRAIGGSLPRRGHPPTAGAGARRGVHPLHRHPPKGGSWPVPGGVATAGRLLASLPALARLAGDWTRLYPDNEVVLQRLRSELAAAGDLPELATWFVTAFHRLIEGMFRITGALSAAAPSWFGERPEVVTAALAADLRAAQADDSPEAWATFLARWGHRGEYESDPASPRGGELTRRRADGATRHSQGSPEFVGSPRRPLAPSPRLLLPDPLGALPAPLQRLPLLAPRHLLAHREWFKDGAMRLWASFRARMLAAAAELVDQELLAAPEEIWRLTPAQIIALPVEEWRTAIRSVEGCPLAAPEANLFWSDTLQPPRETQAGGSAASRDRLPLVPGRVCGPALVARTPTEALAMLDRLLAAGERSGRPILLAPAVDPGWLPVFIRVAGVATELGGRLSHAATLLRELRIPSVLNLPGVTRAAHSGEVIELRVPPGDVRRLTSS